MHRTEPQAFGCVTVAVAGGMGKSAVIEFLRAFAQAAGYRVGVDERRKLLPGDSGVGALETDESPRHDNQRPFGTGEPYPFDLRVVELDSGDLHGPPPGDVDAWVLLPEGREPSGCTPWMSQAWWTRLPTGSVCVAAAGVGLPEDMHVQTGVRLLQAPRDFRFDADPPQWRWSGPGRRLGGLAFPAMRGTPQLGNASAALAVLDALAPRLPVPAQAVRVGLAQSVLPGRFQILPGQPAVVLDLAHTAQAARAAALSLDRMGFHPRTLALIDASAAEGDSIRRELGAVVDEWQAVPPEQAPEQLALRLASANPTDRLLVCGSYAIVAAVLDAGLPRLRAAHVA